MPGDTLSPDAEQGSLEFEQGTWAEVQEPLENQEPVCPEWALPNSPLLAVGKMFRGAPITETRLQHLRAEAKTTYRLYEDRHARWMNKMYPTLAERQVEGFQQIKDEMAQRPAPILSDLSPEPERPQQPNSDGPAAEARRLLAEAHERIGAEEDVYDTVVSPFTEEDRRAAQARLNEHFPNPRNMDEPPPSEEDGWVEVEGDWPTPPDPR